MTDGAEVRGRAAIWVHWCGILLLCFLSAAISSCASQKTASHKKKEKDQPKVYATEGGTEREEYWPSGSGADNNEAPARKGLPRESQQQVSDATPAPVSNRPVDRPLDPTGMPVTAPTP